MGSLRRPTPRHLRRHWHRAHQGSLQTWANGYLKVLLEPLTTGARPRFQSMHGTSKGWIDGGVVLAVSGAVLAATLGVLAAFGGKPIPVGFWGVLAGFVAGGAAMWSYGRAKTGTWLPTRTSQFRLLGDEARRITEAAAPRLQGPSSSTEVADVG